jgi:hypothetical protein
VGQQQEQQQNEQQQHSIQSPLPSAWRSYVNPTRAVAPAGTNVDISEEWYNRQRQKIVLGDRVPYVHSGAWASPSATIVGDVDVHERVRVLLTFTCGGGDHQGGERGASESRKGFRASAAGLLPLLLRCALLLNRAPTHILITPAIHSRQQSSSPTTPT